MNDGSILMMFKYDANSDNGQGQTEYTLNFPTNVVADVLVVGGGGAGGAYERSASYGTIASTGICLVRMLVAGEPEVLLY